MFSSGGRAAGEGMAGDRHPVSGSCAGGSDIQSDYRREICQNMM